MAIGTIVSWIPIPLALWIYAENFSVASLLPYGMALVGLMAVLGITITVVGVTYAIWHLIHTR